MAVAVIVTSRRWIGAAVVASVVVLAGCSGSGDDAGSPTGSVSTPASLSTPPIAPSASVPGSSLPTTSYTVVAGDYLLSIASAAGVSVDEIVATNGWADGADHLIRPGDVIRLPSGATAGQQAPPRPTGSGTDEADSYVEVGWETGLEVGPDGATEAIVDPLNDGTYYASSYSLTADGSGIVFDLARFISADACITALGTVPMGTVDGSDCFGGVVDTSTTAQVTLPVDGPVPVTLGDDCGTTQSCAAGNIRYLRVSTREFARLLAGEPPSAGAPAGFEGLLNWDTLVEIRDGSIVRVNQRWTS